MSNAGKTRTIALPTAAAAAMACLMASAVLVGCGGNNDSDGGSDASTGTDSTTGTDATLPDGGMCPPPGVMLPGPCANPAEGMYGAILFFTVDVDASAAMLGIDQLSFVFDIDGNGFMPFLDPDPASMMPLTFPTQVGIRACSPSYGAGNATVSGLVGGMVVAEATTTFDGQDCLVKDLPVTLMALGPDPCGDGMCDTAGGENNCTCPMDCVVMCGDGCCSAGEDNASCPADCP